MQPCSDPLTLLAREQKRLVEPPPRRRGDLHRTGSKVDTNDDPLGARVVTDGDRDGAALDLQIVEMKRCRFQRLVNNAVEPNALRGARPGDDGGLVVPVRRLRR